MKKKYLEMLKEKLNSFLEKEENEKPIVLDDKVDEFINWYYENMLKGQDNDLEEYREPIELRNFIEKMAVWYELRFPNDDKEYINRKMFEENIYLKSQIDEDSDIQLLDWAELYNLNAFTNTLPNYEYYFLAEPRYQSLYCHRLKILNNNNNYYYYLTAKGRLRVSTLYSSFKNSPIIEIKDNNGKTVKLNDVTAEEFLNFLDSNSIKIASDTREELLNAINNYKQDCYFKEELLNCVMYRIIERGGNRIGPRRGLLFAQEFNRNIDIPMIYGIDTYDPNLDDFIAKYLEWGGNPNLVCYENYFDRTKKYEKVEKVTIKDIYDIDKNKKQEAMQNLVNVLKNHAEDENFKKEEIKRLRIERKLNRN